MSFILRYIFCSSFGNSHNDSLCDFVNSAVKVLMLGSYVSGLVCFLNVHVESSTVTLFLYYLAIIIASAYRNFAPLGTAKCIVLMEALILYNSFLVFYVDAWVLRPIIMVVIFTRISLMVSSLIVILRFNCWVCFLLR